MPSVDLFFPIKGVTDTAADGRIPPGFTHRNGALNVHPFDGEDEKLRGGVRPGSEQYLTDPVKAGFQIQRLTQGRTAVIPSIIGAWKKKYADPSILTGAGSDVEFSPDGKIVVFATTATPFIHAYKFDPILGFGTKLADPAALPVAAARHLAFSPDGKFLAVAHDGTPFVAVYNFSSAGFGTKLADPAILPNGDGRGVAFNPAGTVLAVTDTQVFDPAGINAYAFSSAGFGVKFAAPATSLGVSVANGSLDFSPDGAFIAAGFGASPRVHVYNFSTTTGFGSKLADPSPIPPGGNDVEFHPSQTFIAIVHGTNTPFVSVYNFSAGFGSKLADPSTLPGGAAEQVKWTSKGTAVVMAGSPSTPTIIGYDFTKNVFGAKLADPSPGPPVGISGIDLGPNDDSFVGVSLAGAGVRQHGYVFLAPFPGSIRETKLAIVVNGDIHITDSPPTTAALATGGAAALDLDTTFMEAIEGPPGPTDTAPANIQQHVYYADGTSYKKLNLVTDTVSAWVALTGTLPTDSSGNIGNLLTLFNGRIVISGLPDDPTNWFMSAADDPLDFDFFPVTFTETSAIAGTSAVGRNVKKIGDIVTALAVHTRDTMIFGADHSMWRMSGDPAAGGRIDLISPDVGILGGDAVTISPDQTMFFMGTNGFNRLAPDQAFPELISAGKLDKTFRTINRGVTRVILNWDRDLQGCHIFLVPLFTPFQAPEHFWYDQRTDGFWPIKYPRSNGPTASIVFDGDEPDDRALLLGGLDGIVRRIRRDRVNDDNVGEVAIDSRVDIGPLHKAGLFHDQLMNNLIMILSGESGNVNLEVFSGGSPEEAINSTSPRFKRVINGARTLNSRDRVSDHSILIRLSQNELDATWAYEQGSVVIDAVGQVRGRVK